MKAFIKVLAVSSQNLDSLRNHGNITRSKAEELLSRTGKDGSFLVRASESISRAYALCVL